MVHIVWRRADESAPGEIVAVFGSHEAAYSAVQVGRGTIITSHWLADRA